MANLLHLGPFRHLRAEPNQYIIHYVHGEPVLAGPGKSYWFYALSAAVVQVPVEDNEVTFVLKERSQDLQEVTVQCTVIYRITNANKAAEHVNFAISLDTGAWVEQPLQRLASVWSQRAQEPARAYLITVPLAQAIQVGPQVIRTAMAEALKNDAEIAAMGLTLVSVQVIRVAPTAELEKALQTPTHEEIQQKADEAIFARRALAVEKERAIKENELATQIELARKEEQLIRQKASNELLKVQKEAEAKKEQIVATGTRRLIAADTYAQVVEKRARGDAQARRLVAEAEAEADQRRVAVWQAAPAKVSLGLALQEFASKVQNIQHLNLSPDLLGDSLKQFLRDQAGA